MKPRVSGWVLEELRLTALEVAKLRMAEASQFGEAFAAAVENRYLSGGISDFEFDQFINNQRKPGQ